MTSNPHPEHGPLWVERNSRRCGYRPTAPEPAAAPFCTRCDGYGVVLPVGSSIAATCPACNGNTADRPERGPKHEPAAAPRVDTAAVREIAALFDPPHPADAGLLYAAADELDTHHARHAELVALVADLRENGEKFRQYGYLGIAEHLARILGEQP